MKRNKRALSAVLAAALTAALLAGCGAAPGKAPTGGPETGADGKVWASEFTQLKGLASVQQAFAIPGGFLAAGTGRDGETTKLWRCDTASGSCEELSGYEKYTAPEELEDGYSEMRSAAACEDGSLLVLESVSGLRYALPEGFSGSEEDKYEYMEYVSSTVLRRLDSSGRQLGVIDLSQANAAAAEKVEALGEGGMDGVEPTKAAPAPEGGALLVYNQNVVVAADAEGGVRFADGLEGWWEGPVSLGDGRLGFVGFGGEGIQLRAVDFEAKGFSQPEKLPAGAYTLYAGGGEFSACYLDSSVVYGCRPDSDEGVRLASLVNCDVDEDSIRCMSVDAQGGINCLVSYDSGGDAQLVRIRLRDASELKDTTILRLACSYLEPELRRAILKFNRLNRGVRIEVKDYSQYATQDDYSAGVTKLNTEIISGNVPDLFVADNLPIERYAAKGLLYDLYGLIDKDAELKRGSFFENILAAYETDGGLYSIAPNFRIMTIAGKAETVGEEPGWTLEELMAVVKAHPEAQYVFEPYMTRPFMLTNLLTLTLGRYVDWSSGKCSFDGGDFASLLEFCRLLPEDYDPEQESDGSELLSSGRQLLEQLRVDDFNGFRMNKGMFGARSVLKGYPSADRQGNVVQFVGSRLSISSSCKNVDEAWNFVRSLLTEDAYDSSDRFLDGFPINREAYGRAEAEAMKKTYMTDPETGEKKEQPIFSWNIGDHEAELYALNEAEAAELRALIGSVKYAYSYDTTIMDMIKEETDNYFAGRSSAEQTAALIQNRVSIYVNEQR